MTKVILYSTGCTNCQILKRRLITKKINFVEINEKDIIQVIAEENKFTSVPILFVDGEYLNFSKSMQMINTLG